MSAAVNVNGQLFDQEHAVISVFDHGFLYGEGVYETLRTYHGRPFLFDRHMRRLRASAGMINLEVPLTDAAIAERFDETVGAAGLAGPGLEAYIRLLVTRGTAQKRIEARRRQGLYESSGALAVGENFPLIVPEFLANAFAHATGRRVAALPLTRDRVLEALA